MLIGGLYLRNLELQAGQRLPLRNTGYTALKLVLSFTKNDIAHPSATTLVIDESRYNVLSLQKAVSKRITSASATNFPQ
jgi:hypothetical protein